MQMPNWPTMQMPVTAYKTFAISSPAATHYRKATCEEAGCLAHQHGWRTRVDISTELGRKQAHYIQKLSGRKYVETVIGPTVTEFEFEAGQQCFASDQHRVPVGRPQLFVVRDGDFRGNPTGQKYQHTRPEFWVEQFAEHQQTLADAHNQG